MKNKKKKEVNAVHEVRISIRIPVTEAEKYQIIGALQFLGGINGTPGTLVAGFRVAMPAICEYAKEKGWSPEVEK